MGAVYEVHNLLGPGFTEDIYEKALVQELEAQGIPFEEQKQVVVSYKVKAVGTYRLDLLIENKITLELKAVSALTEAHQQQLLSYLKATNMQLGILVNFGQPRVETDRIINGYFVPG